LPGGRPKATRSYATTKPMSTGSGSTEKFDGKCQHPPSTARTWTGRAATRFASDVVIALRGAPEHLQFRAAALGPAETAVSVAPPEGDTPVMKLNSKGVGQLIALCSTVRETLSPTSGVNRKSGKPDRFGTDRPGPNRNEFPPLANATRPPGIMVTVQEPTYSGVMV
jgi:hypothetical protein